MRTSDAGPQATNFPVVIGAGSHPFPFRTRKLSLLTPMVLRGKLRRREGRCRDYSQEPAVARRRALSFSRLEWLPMSDRFAFGKNWSAFLSVINEQRISAAAEQLRLKVGDVSGTSFLDIGSGSGIHSLAAVR